MSIPGGEYATLEKQFKNTFQSFEEKFDCLYEVLNVVENEKLNDFQKAQEVIRLIKLDQIKPQMVLKFVVRSDLVELVKVLAPFMYEPTRFAEDSTSDRVKNALTEAENNQKALEKIIDCRDDDQALIDLKKFLSEGGSPNSVVMIKGKYYESIEYLQLYYTTFKNRGLLLQLLQHEATVLSCLKTVSTISWIFFIKRDACGFVTLLERSDFDFNRKSDHPIFYMLQKIINAQIDLLNEQITLLYLFLAHPRIDPNFERGWQTPLTYLMSIVNDKNISQVMQCVDALLQCERTDPNKQDGSGNTALQVLVFRRKVLEPKIYSQLLVTLLNPPLSGRCLPLTERTYLDVRNALLETSAFSAGHKSTIRDYLLNLAGDAKQSVRQRYRLIKGALGLDISVCEKTFDISTLNKARERALEKNARKIPYLKNEIKDAKDAASFIQKVLVLDPVHSSSLRTACMDELIKTGNMLAYYMQDHQGDTIKGGQPKAVQKLREAYKSLEKEYQSLEDTMIEQKSLATIQGVLGDSVSEESIKGILPYMAENVVSALQKITARFPHVSKIFSSELAKRASEASAGDAKVASVALAASSSDLAATAAGSVSHATSSSSPAFIARSFGGQAAPKVESKSSSTLATTKPLGAATASSTASPVQLVAASSVALAGAGAATTNQNAGFVAGQVQIIEQRLAPAKKP